MKHLSRRNLLLGAGALPAVGGLAACTVSRDIHGALTAAIDVGRVVRDGQALIRVVSAVLSEPTMAILLGANTLVANAALAAANAALAEVEALTGGRVVIDLDVAHVTALTQSVIGNAQTVIALAQNVLAQLTGKVFADISRFVGAAATFIPLLSLSIGLAGAQHGVVAPMTEVEALAVAAAAPGDAK